ncbi:YciI family protein [Streptomyces formicae]|uniref:YCII-related domain-containing protein n=1 Tax=Streptomyces formicae TaxID=1616117 RepID=A0ABY3WPS8_9ACTN|nr:YciI family protein [Streptomyces formicae]UNM13327.1 hypothetical protein J4032_19170 [Streptomyces formicae]
MSKYVLLTYLPVDGAPTKEEVGARWGAYHKALLDSGVLVANSGLAGTDTATTVRVRDGETQITDGPFAETKEYLAGFFVIDVADLDEALKWAADMPNSSYGPVEVRPVWNA